MFENIHVDVNKFLFSSLDISDYQTIESVELFEHRNAHFFLGGIIWLTFGFAFLSESLFSLAVFFLMAFLPLLQTVVARFQKHFIDFVGVDFDPDVAIRRGSGFAFQNQKSVLDVVQFIDLLIMQTVNIVFIVWDHYLWFENDYL